MIFNLFSFFGILLVFVFLVFLLTKVLFFVVIAALAYMGIKYLYNSFKSVTSPTPEDHRTDQKFHYSELSVEEYVEKIERSRTLSELKTNIFQASTDWPDYESTFQKAYNRKVGSVQK